jgi:uncharacterized RDD family membrane protein YckC
LWRFWTGPIDNKFVLDGAGGRGSVRAVTNTAGSIGARRRALASVGDYGVIAGWLGALGAVSAVGRAVAGPPRRPPDIPLPAYDLAIAAMTVLPVGAYLARTEAGPRQASAGKRWQDLRVTTAAGEPIGWRRAVVRNAVKLLPWQLGHLAVVRLAQGRESPAVWALQGLSLVLAGADVVTALRDPRGRAVHDLVAGTRVVAGLAGHTTRTSPITR